MVRILQANKLTQQVKFLRPIPRGFLYAWTREIPPYFELYDDDDDNIREIN